MSRIRFIKVRHTEGVLYRGNFLESAGNSKVDNLPLYRYIHTEGTAVNWKRVFEDFVFNGKPRYVPDYKDFETIDYIQTHSGAYELPTSTAEPYLKDIIMPRQTEEQEERLLLMI